MAHSSVDTIFALATPPGMSAVAIIRISGARALDAPVLFGVKAAPPPRVASRAFLKDSDGAVLDDVMLVGFCAPASATGEDVLKFNVMARRRSLKISPLFWQILKGLGRQKLANLPAARWIMARWISLLLRD